MVTAEVFTSWGSGGRTLRIVTRTPSHPVERQQVLGDALGDALEQEVLLGLHHLLGHGHGHAVVDGVVEVVGGAGGGEVGFEVEVELEGLGPLALLGQHADDAEGAQASDLDPVRHGG